MYGRINVAEAPEIMVSRPPAYPIEKANPAWMPRPHSPLEKTPHKARNGVISITCRNRHCPKCQTNARDKWLAARQQELLPTTLCALPRYVVFDHRGRDVWRALPQEHNINASTIESSFIFRI
jgi:hypothetical protein